MARKKIPSIDELRDYQEKQKGLIFKIVLKIIKHLL